MGICLNVYRRGAVYWWRCRFGPAGNGVQGRDVALSLRTCDPRSARSLGVRLNAEAEQARRALREGGGGSLGSLRVALVQAAEDMMRTDRIVTEQGHVFEMSGTVVDGFLAAKAAREAARPTGFLTTEIERRILERIGRDAATRLDRKMAVLRSVVTFDFPELISHRSRQRAICTPPARSTRRRRRASTPTRCGSANSFR